MTGKKITSCRDFLAFDLLQEKINSELGNLFQGLLDGRQLRVVVFDKVSPIIADDFELSGTEIPSS